MTQMNLSMKQTYGYRKQTCSCQGVTGLGGGHMGGMDWGFGISRCKLLYTEWTNNNKVLLYSTGNYIQCPVINYNVKEYEKQYKYMYN